jgi:Na+/proline symporter
MLGGLIWLPIPVVAGFIAMAASKLGVNIPHVNMVGPLVTVKLLGTVGALCVFIIVFSSIASSVDSLLAATSDLVTKEVLGVWWKRKDDLDHRLEKATPRVIVALALVTWGVCLTGKQDLASLLFRAGPLVGSLTWPIVAGLYWSKTNRHAVIAAMVAGSATGLWAHHTWGWYTAALVGTAVSMVLTLVGSAIRPHDFSWARAQQSAGSTEAQGI